MEDQDKAWREIQLLIARDKAAALEEFRHLPFRPAAPARPPAWLRPHPALAAVAASLLLAVALAALWLLRANWESVPTAPAWSGILSNSFLYAAAGQTDTAPGQGEHRAVSPIFNAWTAAALQPDGEEKETRDESGTAVVERGDPEEVRRRIGRAIRDGAFEQLLSNLYELNNEEA